MGDGGFCSSEFLTLYSLAVGARDAFFIPVVAPSVGVFCGWLGTDVENENL